MKSLIITQFHTKGIKFIDRDRERLTKAIQDVIAQKVFGSTDYESDKIDVGELKVSIRQYEKVEVLEKDLGFVNVTLTASKNEVRLWARNNQGVSVFRLKALGDVHIGQSDIIVTT